jgi:hypothetical protein
VHGPARDPRNPFDERDVSRAVLLTVLVCAASGAGVGVFFEQPAIGGIAGGVLGVLVGALVVPRLMQDWDG